MEIEIKFRHTGDPQWPCAAHCVVNDEALTAIGQTWAEAKTELLRKLNAYATLAEPPASESVDIDL